MKRRRSNYTAIVVFLLGMLFNVPGLFAQEEIALASPVNDEISYRLPKTTLRLTLSDTVMPTLCNAGKGLLHYDCVILEQKKKICIRKYEEGKQIMVIHSGLTEEELQRFRNQLRLIDEQCQFEMKKHIRKNKIDLNLGEAIKGFYMKPVF